MTAKYDDHDWKELPAEVQKAAVVLGYNKKMWDNDKSPPTDEQEWKDLTAAQQAAAIILGYTEESWNSESDSD
eukprot:CAMPEP_0119012482 /NCGR_PEP_ID=MMETSP1176-20130426/6771_1 /TAXON_ID=265551 /ORGANISM="Synedropsis recta cf, Strain CCMP1620" /LENGTH=72 /DNA_ID=CAMNT_0006965447 /DNA_START=30 /DNA_END=248 /DNA_ORIENTATION=+